MIQKSSKSRCPMSQVSSRMFHAYLCTLLHNAVDVKLELSLEVNAMEPGPYLMLVMS